MGDPLLGRVLGGSFRIERRLGEGGMGAVYAARHVRTGRPYAVKVLLPEARPTPGAVQRFRREAEAVSALGHAGIVAVHDFATTDDGMPYIVMDLLEGQDLADRLARDGALRWEDARRTLAQVASALSAAHAVGILHRDLKPANVFLSRRPGAPEQAVLLDFGLAKLADEGDSRLTATGTVMGTPSYMSPEQARGEPVDARTDVYSLAAVLFEMLTGAPPFTGPNSTAILARVLTEPPPVVSTRAREALPRGLDALMQAALAKSREARPESVERFASALAALDGAAAGPPPTRVREAVPATRATPAPVSAQRSRARGPVLGLAVAALAAVALAGGVAAILVAASADGDTVPPATGPEPGQPDPVAPARVADVEVAPEPKPDPVVAPPDEEVEAPGEPEAAAPARPRPGQGRRSSRDGARDPAPAPAPTPAAGGSAPPAMPTPVAGVTEAVARMQESDWRGCIREARAAPVSAQTLQLQVSCGLQLADRATVERACDAHVRRFPSHPFSQSCPALAQGMAASGP